MIVDLSGMRALVTGAGRGIGRATALRLAECGADIAIVDRNLQSQAEVTKTPEEPTVKAVAALGRRAIGVQADLTDEIEARGAVDRVVVEWGGLDLLVNIAGGAITPIARSAATVMPLEDLRRLLDINLMATVYLCQQAAPALRASAAEGRRPAIVNRPRSRRPGSCPAGCCPATRCPRQPSRTTRAHSPKSSASTGSGRTQSLPDTR
jgi:NAD(P)-dependent dehydrogenase (short-subunit alcohol dehydrogenase family)